MAAKSEKSQGAFRRFFSRIGRFFLDVRAETKRIVWPTAKQVFNNFIVVLCFVLIATLFIAAIDVFFTWVIALLLDWAKTFDLSGASSSVSSVAAAITALLA